jgi:hypothetical protein
MMVVVVGEEVQGVVIVMVPLTKGAESLLFSIQDHLLVLQMMVSINIHEDSQVIDRDECHLYEVREGIVVVELCEVLPVVD